MGAGFTKFSSWFANEKEEIQIVMAGLGGSGKTTILNKLKLGEMLETRYPTVGFNVGTIEYKDVSFYVMDIGGQERQIITLMSMYFPKRRALIFVVDSNCREWIAMARDDLHIKLKEEALKDVILLVIANKQDLPNAMNVDEITDQLDLRSLTHHPWYVQSTCATSGVGLNAGLEWLYNNLANKNN